MDGLSDLEARLGHKFAARALLLRALTHRSWAHEHGTTDNERLEFLGDAVLQMAITLHLLERFPERAEGELSKIRSRLVSRTALAEVADGLALAPYLRLDAGAAKEGGRHNSRLLANAVEALIGAVHRDAGFAEARAVVLGLLEHRVDEAAERVDAERDNPVSTLQELVQGERGITPRYVDLGQHGDPHTPTFRVAVEVDGDQLADGEGGTKKAARRNAARNALAARGVP